VTVKRDIRDVIRSIPRAEFERFANKHMTRWLKNNGDKYYSKVQKIVKEYAAKVDVGREFRSEWNSSHPPWEQYSTKSTADLDKRDFVNHVKYNIKEDGDAYFYNDAQPDPPFTYTDYKGEVHTWKSNPQTTEDALSNWIEGDPATGDSCIHPIPPYTVIDKRGRADLIIWKGWIDNAEWKNMWYKGDPYMQKAFDDSRVQKIMTEMGADWGKAFRSALLKKYGKSK
jgi:hypothetical protein